MKWFVDLDEKLRVVAALAEALDLLRLPRYAAICRSGTTREILNAYEVSTARGKAAFRRAAAGRTSHRLGRPRNEQPVPGSWPAGSRR